MTTIRPNIAAKTILALFMALWAGVAAAGAVEPEPLTLRVHDASAPPGGLVAVVLRTYAARPIRQGQICMVVRRFRQKSTDEKKNTLARQALPGAAFRAPATGPFASMEGAFVFSDANDTIEQAQFLPTDTGQPTMLEFSSISATINASDGPLLVLYYRLRPDVIPGEVYELDIDLANTLVLDADNQPILIDSRSGELVIRAPTDPISASAAAEAPDVFDMVMLSLQTEEPIPISSGQLGLRYSQELLPGTPKIQIDPRYGNGDWNFVHIRGLIVVQFSSPDLSLNTVPGDIVSLYLELNPNAGPGADRSIWFDPAYTFLYDAEGNALTLDLDGDVIP